MPDPTPPTGATPMPDSAAIPISQRECDRCQDGFERTLKNLDLAIDHIAKARSEDSTRIEAIDKKVDAVALDVKEIQTILGSRREIEKGFLGIIVKALPWIVAALLGGGGLYRASQPTDPAAIVEAVKQIQEQAP